MRWNLVIHGIKCVAKEEDEVTRGICKDFAHTVLKVRDTKETVFAACHRLSPHMMTSSNGNIFRVTGPLCREFTGPGEFPAQRPVTRSFDVFSDLHPNKRLGKQPWGWWFETLSWSLWRQCNDLTLLSLWGLWTSLNVIGGWLVRSTLRITVARWQSLLTCPLCWELWKMNWLRNVLNCQPRSIRNPASSFFPSGPLSNSKLMASHPNVQWISIPLPLRCSMWTLCLFCGSPLNHCPRHLAHHKQHNINEFPFFFTIYLYWSLRYSHPVYEKYPALFCCGNVVTDSPGFCGVTTLAPGQSSRDSPGAVGVIPWSAREWAILVFWSFRKYLCEHYLWNIINASADVSVPSDARASVDALFVISSSVTVKVYFQYLLHVTSQNVLSFLLCTHFNVLPRW